MKAFKVYEQVWIMENNKPVSKLVYSIIEEMNYWKNGTETHYTLVNGTLGATSAKAIHRDVTKIFREKSELLSTL